MNEFKQCLFLHTHQPAVQCPNCCAWLLPEDWSYKRGRKIIFVGMQGEKTKENSIATYTHLNVDARTVRVKTIQSKRSSLVFAIWRGNGFNVCDNRDDHNIDVPKSQNRFQFHVYDAYIKEATTREMV